MPYFESLDWDTVSSSYYTGDPLEQGKFRVRGSRDVSWRSNPSKTAKSSKVLPTSSVEPYSWFIQLQEFKKQTLIDSGRFDVSAFRTDSGHAWENEKWIYKVPLHNFSVASPVGLTHYRNVMPGWGSSAPFPHAFETHPSGLESWAATQYGRMAPSVSEFSLSSFLGELREGLPRAGTAFLSSKVKNYKALGDDYLNVEFGWKPFLDDLQQLALKLLEASYGLFRPFGATHRSRGAIILDDTLRLDALGTAFAVEVGAFQKALPSYQVPDGQSVTTTVGLRADAYVTRRRKQTRSIEGEFVYIPKAGFDPSKYIDRLETLISTEITPSVLWQLAPWSWLVDWFQEIGDAVASMEAAMNNRILSTYLYAMETTEVSVASSLIGIRPRFAGYTYYGVGSYKQELVYTHKRRIRANPFGFTGSQSTHLTGEQGAILGALGLTRLK
jgi:hypothetical protein